MKRRRTPKEKKQLDARKQRRGYAEYHHALRHGKWRKNKRRPAQQSERQAERAAVSDLTGDPADPGFDPGVIRRPTIGRWPNKSLGEWIEQRKERCPERAGGKRRRRAARKRRTARKASGGA
jgi:hypothetical protein